MLSLEVKGKECHAPIYRRVLISYRFLRPLRQRHNLLVFRDFTAATEAI